MRHLGKIVATTVAALVLTAPATEADPGINANTAGGSIIFAGSTECVLPLVPVIGFPPETVIIPATSFTCGNGYWGSLNEDMVIDFDDTPTPDTGNIRSVDVTGGVSFFWCRYIATNLGLTRTDDESNPNFRKYEGGPYLVPLHSSNWPSQCSNPASTTIRLNLYRS